MSKKYFVHFLLVASSAFAVQAQAVSDGGFFFEPGITYEASESSVNYPRPLNDSSGSVNGFGVMGRIGGHFMESFFAGADARYSRPTLKDSSFNTTSDANAWNYGVTVGGQMPVGGVRLWGTYVIGAELDPAGSNGWDAKFTDGKGFRVGAGVYYEMVSINLEYQDLKYDNTQATVPIVGTYNFDSAEMQNKSWIVSLSFPLAL